MEISCSWYHYLEYTSKTSNCMGKHEQTIDTRSKFCKCVLLWYTKAMDVDAYVSYQMYNINVKQNICK